MEGDSWKESCRRAGPLETWWCSKIPGLLARWGVVFLTHTGSQENALTCNGEEHLVGQPTGLELLGICSTEGRLTFSFQQPCKILLAQGSNWRWASKIAFVFSIIPLASWSIICLS